MTERERAYLNAVKVLYGEGDKATRDKAYSVAMEKIFAIIRKIWRRPALCAVIAGICAALRAGLPAPDESWGNRSGCVSKEAQSSGRGALHHSCV